MTSTEMIEVRLGAIFTVIAQGAPTGYMGGGEDGTQG